MFTIAATIYAVLSIFVSFLVVIVAMRSSQISQREQVIEVYERANEPSPIVSNSYSFES